jgi:hypothetical protein
MYMLRAVGSACCALGWLGISMTGEAESVDIVVKELCVTSVLGLLLFSSVATPGSGFALDGADGVHEVAVESRFFPDEKYDIVEFGIA